MRVLLTGATGFVGGRVAARLRGRGDAVVALVRRPSAALEDLGVRQEVAELTDRRALAALANGTDAAVHAAAALGGDLDAARRVNRDGTAALVAAVGDAGVPRLVHVSTTSVYDRRAAGASPIAEDAPLVRDGGAYAVTKAEAEGEVTRAGDGGPAALVLRPPAVLGAGERSVWGHHVPRSIARGEHPVRHPADTFAWVHVEDLVTAVCAGLDGTATGPCNVVGGHARRGDYLRAVAAAVGAPAPVSTDAEPGWQGRFADARLGELLGVRPSDDLAGALAEIADWWRRTAEADSPRAVLAPGPQRSTLGSRPGPSGRPPGRARDPGSER